MEHWLIGPAQFRRAAVRGFTAIELLVVVAIVAILAALAAPSFTPLIDRWRVRQAVEGFQSSMYYARSEAIKRGGNVVIEKLPNNTNGCTTAIDKDDWDCGWEVLACSSVSASGVCADREVLQRFDTPSGLQVTRKSGGERIKLNRWGLVDGTWVGMSLVPFGKSTSNPAAAGICISAGGRIRVISDPPCTSG